VQVRELPVVPEATQVPVVQVDQAEFIQVQFREDLVVLQATQAQVVQVEFIQVQVREDQVVPEVTQVLVVRVELLELIQV